jgi:hypothetical protein
MYCPRDVLDSAVAALPRAEVRVLEAADHFFGGALRPLGEAVEAWARRLAGKSAGGGRPG